MLLEIYVRAEIKFVSRRWRLAGLKKKITPNYINSNIVINPLILINYQSISCPVSL